MTIFFFSWRLVTTSRKGIVAMFREILAPLRGCAVGHAQFAGNVGLRFLAGRKKAHRLSLKLFRVRFFLFLHSTRSPLWNSLFRVSSLHKGGPWSIDFWSHPVETRCLEIQRNTNQAARIQPEFSMNPVKPATRITYCQ